MIINIKKDAKKIAIKSLISNVPGNNENSWKSSSKPAKNIAPVAGLNDFFDEQLVKCKT